MTRVSYFQRYSQRENHATNNTLLILRYFYQVAPHRLQQALNSLLGEEFSLGLTFHPQVKLKSSVPDAMISQKAFNIYVEAKMGDNLDLDQIGRDVLPIFGAL